MEVNISLINKIKEEALKDKVPIMEEDGLNYVIQFLKEKDIHSLLEIGTAVGYSSICFASSKNDLKIVTLEKDMSRYEKAIKNIAEVGLNDRIKAILTDAREFTLEEEFDCLFLDGPKAHNQQLLDNYSRNLKKNGYIVVDDVYFHGFVDHPELLNTPRLKPLVKKLTKFRNDMLNSKEYECQYLEIGDGLLICRRRESYE